MRTVKFVAAVVALALSGCVTPGAVGVPWEAAIPDTTPPAPPEVAPDVDGACPPGSEKIIGAGEPAECVGMLSNPSDYQYLLDVEAQAGPMRDLLAVCNAETPECRAWADKHYARVVAERDKARRQRWEALGGGAAIGAGAAAGLILAILFGTR